MANIFPIGISRGNPDEGQSVPLSSDNAAVDTSNNMIQFASPSGFTGFFGLTGVLNADQGITGFAFPGVSGARGATGVVGPTGGQGLAGITGYIGAQGSNPGITGLSGITGVQSVTGAVGQTGLRGLNGFEGYTGLAGVAGLPGVTGLSSGGETGIIGDTGIQGATGIDTALVGITGLAFLGVTGLQGFTGIIGATGLTGTAAISIAIQQVSSIANALAGSLITTNGQQIQFRGLGLLSDMGVSNTVTLTLGSTTLITIASGSIMDSFVVEGLIVRTGASSQRIGAQFLFYSGLTYTVSTTAAESWASSPGLTLTVSAPAGNYGAVELASYLVDAS